MKRSAAILVAAFVVHAMPALAQGNSAPKASPADSVFARARLLVVNGNGAAGRVLLDSVVAATSPDAPAYPEALYWRATLAATSTDAERDYQRIVVEYPLSPREPNALFQLAQLEVARGDRESASKHLQRYVLENPKGSDASRAQLLLVRVSFERNDLPRGCVALGRALAGVPDSAVELRNQLAYYSPRCSGVDTTYVGKFVSAEAADSARRAAADSVAADSTRKAEARKADSVAAAAKRAKYTLQIAAYSSKAEAEKLAKKLQGRGIDARVVGTKKPYRVRVGRYETRAAALAAAKTLKTKKIDAFVTDIGADDR